MITLLSVSIVLKRQLDMHSEVISWYVEGNVMFKNWGLGVVAFINIEYVEV